MLIVVTVATYPELPIASFVIAMLVAAVVVPVVLYPFSYTGWSAVDLAMHRPEPAELAEMEQVAAGRRRSCRTGGEESCDRSLNERLFVVTLVSFGARGPPANLCDTPCVPSEA